MEGEHKKIDANSQECPAIKKEKMKTKNWKIWTGVVAALIAMMNMVPVVSAAESAEITVTVMVQWLSMTASPGTWDLGTVLTSTTKTMASGEKITVKNDGNVPESFTLQVTNTGGTWTASTTEDAAADTFVMQGVFSGKDKTDIVAGDFGTGGTANEDVILSGSAKTAGSGVDDNFVPDGDHGDKGASVAVNGERALWMQFKAPTSDSTHTQQSIKVTIGVVAA